MPRRPCIGRLPDGTLCGEITDGSYCPRHERPAWANRSPSSRATARPGWNRLRDLALQRDGHACAVCGSDDRLAVHHRQPVADGGRNELPNLVTLCHACHTDAHH